MKPLIKTYKAGMHLFHENDRSRELYIIQSGNVKVYRQAGTKEVEITVLGKGAVLGEMALIDGKPRSASAKAVDDCSVVQIDSETFNQRIAGVPGWFMTIIRMASQKIRNANECLKNAPQNNNEKARIIIVLLYLFRKYHFNNTIPVPSVHSNLIQLLGVTCQTTTAVLDFLCKHRFIEIANDQLSIVVFSQYYEYCEFLRMMMRNAFTKVPELSDDLQKILINTAAEYHSVLNSKEPATAVTGSSFWNIISKSGLEKTYNNIIVLLKDQNLLTAVKSESKGTDQNENPLAAYQFKINNVKWKKLCLYAKFKDLIPLC